MVLKPGTQILRAGSGLSAEGTAKGGEIDAGIVMAEKNGDQYRAQTLSLYRAWIQLFGMNHGEAREICESTLPLLDQERRPWRRFALMIAASADVSLGNYDRGLESSRRVSRASTHPSATSRCKGRMRSDDSG